MTSLNLNLNLNLNMPLSIKEQNDFKAAGLLSAEPFRFTLILGRQSEGKVGPTPVETELNQNLKLETYGDVKTARRDWFDRIDDAGFAAYLNKRLNLAA